MCGVTEGGHPCSLTHLMCPRTRARSGCADWMRSSTVVVAVAMLLVVVVVVVVLLFCNGDGNGDDDDDADNDNRSSSDKCP